MAAMMVSATTSAWLWANTPARGRGLPLASRIWLVSPIAYAPSKPVARVFRSAWIQPSSAASGSRRSPAGR